MSDLETQFIESKRDGYTHPCVSCCKCVEEGLMVVLPGTSGNDYHLFFCLQCVKILRSKIDRLTMLATTGINTDE